MPTIYLGLGSNLGDRAGNLRQALDALGPEIQVEAVSHCFETEPAYILDQPRFYNVACRALTELSPSEVLGRIKSIETQLGREPGRRHGPRLVDLDLLLYGDTLLKLPELTVPHARLHERAFVLVPLEEVGADALHPTMNTTVRELRRRLGDTSHLLRLAPECDETLAPAA